MKIDPHRNKERYLRWKQKTEHGIPGITRANSALIQAFLGDFELGLNIAKGTKKGPRSHIRLNALKNRLLFLAKQLEARYDISSIP